MNAAGMNSDEQAIRTLIDTWLGATRNGDVDTLLSLMAPDVVFLVPGQPPLQGRDAFAQALASILTSGQVIDSSSDVVEVEVAGDFAYVRTVLSVTITSRHGGTPMLRNGHTLSILRKGADGNWRFTRDANLLSPAA